MDYNLRRNRILQAVWYWNSSINPNSADGAQWKEYTDEECQIIEAAYQRGKETVELKNYTIDMRNLLQYNKRNTNLVRPIQRGEIDKTQFIEQIKKIGKGGFGTVYLGTYKGRKIAYKVIDDALSNAGQQEADILKGLRHPNIIHYVDVIHTNHHTILIMEHINGGTLLDFINDNHISSSYWRQSASILLNIAYALEYLHAQNIIHADLKSDNVLLRKDLSAVLTDFGLSVAHNCNSCSGNIQRGAIRWLAPELAKSRNKAGNRKSDVWAFGCVIIEMITQDDPWTECQTNSEVLSLLSDNSNFRKLQRKCEKIDAPEPLRKLVYACCSWNEEYRPKIAEIIVELRNIIDDNLLSSNRFSSSSSDFPLERPRTTAVRQITPTPWTRAASAATRKPLYSDYEEKSSNRYDDDYP